MSRNEEFDYGRVPSVLYHGTDGALRSSIASKGLKGGHVTDNVDLAAEYAAPDLYEVRKHPNVIPTDHPDAEGAADFWDRDSGVFWANGVPPSHLKRVGHVISHMNNDGEFYYNEVHWHPKENCHLSFDMVHPGDISPDDVFGKNLRQHPTDPTLKVSNYQ